MNSFDYQPRAVEFKGTLTTALHELKLYRIVAPSQCERKLPDTVILQRIVAGALSGDDYRHDHRIGFVIVHFAADGDYLLVSTWCGANMLRHRVFALQLTGEHFELVSLQPEHIVACVWELAIMYHERNSWIECVLKTGHCDSVQRAAYLTSVYREAVC